MPTTTIPERLLIPEEFVSAGVVANNTATFTVTLSSSEWFTKPGIDVSIALEESRDNGTTWQHLMGFETTSGPLPPPPHDTMPMLRVERLGARGNRRLRVRASATAPILVGATVVSD